MQPSKYYIEAKINPQSNDNVACLNVSRTAETIRSSRPLSLIERYVLVFQSFMTEKDLENFTKVVHFLEGINYNLHHLLIQLTEEQVFTILTLPPAPRTTLQTKYKRRARPIQRISHV
jgi:hypothetical protein